MSLPTKDQPEPAPLEPVVCEGSPYEVGLAQGRGTRDQIRSARDLFSGLEAFRFRKPAFVPLAAFRWLAERRARRLWRDRLDAAVPEMSARLKGIAAGSGASVGMLRLLNVLEPLMADLRDQTDVPPPGGCSAIAIDGSKATDGEPMIARNFDYLPLVQPLYAMRDTRPTDGLRSLDFIAAPLVGAIDGLNEAGLCITNNYAYVKDPPTIDRTVTMSISEALGKCSSVAEAIEFLMHRPRWGGGILMLADAGGDIAALELSNGRAAVRRPTAGEGVLFHTNRFMAAEMADVELDATACYSDAAPASLRGKVVHRSSDLRDARLRELVSGLDGVSPEDLRSILSDHGPDGEPSSSTLCMHSDYWYTTASLQLFPRSRRIRIAFDATCRADPVELALD